MTMVLCISATSDKQKHITLIALPTRRSPLFAPNLNIYHEHAELYFEFLAYNHPFCVLACYYLEATILGCRARTHFFCDLNVQLDLGGKIILLRYIREWRLLFKVCYIVARAVGIVRLFHCIAPHTRQVYYAVHIPIQLTPFPFRRHFHQCYLTPTSTPTPPLPRYRHPTQLLALPVPVFVVHTPAYAWCA
jgi:hypothetical protein